jgi:hypothetical protein
LLEKLLSGAVPTDPYGFASASQTGLLLIQFNTLSKQHKERLLGYLDALTREK